MGAYPPQGTASSTAGIINGDGYQGAGTHASMLNLTSPVRGMTYRVTETGFHDVFYIYRDIDAAGTLGWRPLAQAVIYDIISIGPISAGDANQHLIKSLAIPAGMLQTGMSIYYEVSGAKSAGAESGTIDVYIGNNNSVADNQIHTNTNLATTTKYVSFRGKLRVASTTSITKNAGGATTNSNDTYAASSANTTAATVSNLASNITYLTFWWKTTTPFAETLTANIKVWLQ